MENKIQTERADLFDPNMNIVMLFEVTGQPDPQLLAEAAKRTFTRFGATMSRIVIHGDGTAQYEALPESRCMAEVTTSNLDGLLLKNEKDPLAIENGEMMRVFIRKYSHAIQVLIISHHLTGDGKSVVYFVEQMMREAAGENTPNDFFPLTLLDVETLPVNSAIPKLYKLFANIYNRKWKRDAVRYNMNDRKRLYSAYWKNRESVILKARLSSETADRIRKKSKSIGISANSLLFAAFMKYNDRYDTVGMAVNVRRESNRTMSNQATGITVKYTYNHKLSFDKNAQALHKKIYAKMNNPRHRFFILHFMPLFLPSLIDSMLMASGGLCENRTSKRMAAMLGYFPQNNKTLSITNLTHLDISDTYGAYRIKSLYFIPPVVSYSYQTFGIATMPDGMSIVLHSLTDRLSEKEKQAFDDTIKFLKSDIL